ncbi:MAG: helix-turn-helix domain-containing protein, partial [Shimia sp.]|nr:helix-turn-helix domain-containing protein [Shimia sp.]
MGMNFGATLKEWRQARRVSQLDLGLSAGVSSRHISFLETGRSRPSRGMVLRLCDELDVPIAQRNRMLTSAGLSPAHAERDLSEEDMAPMRKAVDWTLARHDPYPAMAIDRHWRLVKANRCMAGLLAAFGMAEGDSLLDMMTESPM